jgi:hypothetical protein
MHISKELGALENGLRSVLDKPSRETQDSPGQQSSDSAYGEIS